MTDFVIKLSVIYYIMVFGPWEKGRWPRYSPSFALAELYDEMTHVAEFGIFKQLYGRPKFSPHFENVLIPY